MSEDFHNVEQDIRKFVQAWRTLTPKQRQVKERELEALDKGGIHRGFYNALAKELGIGREAMRQHRRRGDARLRRFFQREK